MRSTHDVILPADESFMLAALPLLAQPDDHLSRQLALDQLEELVTSQFHLALRAQHRSSIHDFAAQSITAAQKANRRRYFDLLQRRSEPLWFEVQPGDYVLVADRPRKGLAPAFLGPFRVLRVTGGGNVVLETDDMGTHRRSQQWKVKPSRLYPYKFDYQCHDASSVPSAPSSLQPG